MRLVILVLTGFLIGAGCRQVESSADNASDLAGFVGKFSDDYNSTYVITPELWDQDETFSYRILEWDTDNRFILARNDSLNPSGGGLYSRIDYVEVDSPPFVWAFCLSAYDAETEDEARQASADKSNPREGCNGFPFTRMQPVR